MPLLLGVLPLVSARHAEFLHNEVPGITIPDAARARMRAAGAAGTEAGIEMADALLAAVESEVAGTYLMPSFGRYEQAAELVRRIRARHPHGGGGGLGDGRRAAHGPPWPAVSLVAVAPCVARDARPRPARRRRGGPAVPAPVDDQAVYDTAGASGRDTIAQVEATIDAIEARTGAEVVVYTQLVPYGETTDEAEQQRPRADGPVGRRPGGLRRRARDPVRPPPERPVPRPGPAVRRPRLRRRRSSTNAERQAIFEDDMLPLLQRCDLDGALLDRAAARRRERDARARRPS